MPTEYMKLVRDRIPAIIQQNGSTCETVVIADDNEYQQALREKLIEEACELAVATSEQMLIEMADIYEVLDALISSYGLSPETIRRVQAQRRSERGSFNQRIRLLRTNP
ncbi:nucleoside triphosphate pyrophosphohydrolase [Tengunoibacter tsumagoiensis]|uniref:Phosphoribosyl-ATP pyrophosphohydrolase n=1 Tax=Tengunoibacter tsumagoiensis TaxID=2014871 RepID=A0A401ZX43_9CHLR|nr:nucleoside triphosphate pyrophosphohydrolase [Tengunoibacter tsumagoiensis]GCE11354.1 phosphoribosyl-ATP pyrophosphohydrolase [Tengunoibacter tsumagoiensis]